MLAQLGPASCPQSDGTVEALQTPLPAPGCASGRHAGSWCCPTCHPSKPNVDTNGEHQSLARAGCRARWRRRLVPAVRCRLGPVVAPRRRARDLGDAQPADCGSFFVHLRGPAVDAPRVALGCRLLARLPGESRAGGVGQSRVAGRDLRHRVCGRPAPLWLVVRRGLRALGRRGDVLVVPGYPPSRADAALHRDRLADARPVLGAVALACVDDVLVQPARRLRLRVRRDRTLRAGSHDRSVDRGASARDRLAALDGRRSDRARVPVQSVGLADPRVSRGLSRLGVAVPPDPRVAAAGLRASIREGSRGASPGCWRPRLPVRWSGCARARAMPICCRWRLSRARWRSRRGASSRSSR